MNLPTIMKSILVSAILGFVVLNAANAAPPDRVGFDGKLLHRGTEYRFSAASLRRNLQLTLSLIPGSQGVVRQERLRQVAQGLIVLALCGPHEADALAAQLQLVDKLLGREAIPIENLGWILNPEAMIRGVAHQAFVATDGSGAFPLMESSFDVGTFAELTDFIRRRARDRMLLERR